MSFLDDDEAPFNSMVPADWPRWAIPLAMIAAGLLALAAVILSGAVAW